MIKHFPIDDYLFDHEIIKGSNKWLINFNINDIKYQIVLNDRISYKVLNFKELGYKNHYSRLGDNVDALKIAYNITYFIWLYVNETGKNEISYGIGPDTEPITIEMNNRAIYRYFDEPTIEKKNNKYVITFKEE